MRILHVTHNFPRAAGDPSGNFLLALAREQVALGHDVTVVAPHAAGIAEREIVEGVRVERFRYGSDSQETLAYTGVMHEQVRRSWAGRWRLIAFLRAMRRMGNIVAREQEVDLVHVHWWFPGGLALWRSRAAAARPVLVTSHGTDLFMLRKLPVLRPLARAVLRSAGAITTVSRALAREVAGLGIPSSRVSVISMPLDLATLGHAAAPFDERDAEHLLFVGRLSVQKGVADLLEAMASVAERRPAIRLTVVGDGTERARLERLATELGIESRVDFRGTLAPALVSGFYARASVLVVPSATGRTGEIEGFGLVAAEAMLAGLPVVATSTGGLTDIVSEGRTGLLVPPEDPTALAGAIERLLHHRALARTMAEAARVEVLRRFTPGVIADAYCALYETLVKRSAAAARDR